MKNAPRKETLAVGLKFVAGLAPLLALNAWFAVWMVSRAGSNRWTLLALMTSSALCILTAAYLEMILLLLPMKRCLREAAASGWAFAVPSMFVYFWDLPKKALPWAYAIAGVVLVIWLTLFVKLFAANSRKEI